MPHFSPLKIVVLISGKGSNLQSIIDHIKQDKLDARITAVISNKAGAHGLERAHQNNIPTAVILAEENESREQYDQRLSKIINQYKPDLVICAGFMRIFSDQFVHQFKGRLLNIHPSLLPKYRGLHTHRRALEAGDAEHGASVHFVTPELDSGPVIMQASVPILADDNEQSLAIRVLQEEHLLYPLVIKLYADKRIELCGEKIKLDGREIEKPLPMHEP